MRLVSVLIANPEIVLLRHVCMIVDPEPTVEQLSQNLTVKSPAPNWYSAEFGNVTLFPAVFGKLIDPEPNFGDVVLMAAPAAAVPVFVRQLESVIVVEPFVPSPSRSRLTDSNSVSAMVMSYE